MTRLNCPARHRVVVLLLTVAALLAMLPATAVQAADDDLNTTTGGRVSRDPGRPTPPGPNPNPRPPGPVGDSPPPCQSSPCSLFGRAYFADQPDASGNRADPASLPGRVTTASGQTTTGADYYRDQCKRAYTLVTGPDGSRVKSFANSVAWVDSYRWAMGGTGQGMRAVIQSRKVTFPSCGYPSSPYQVRVSCPVATLASTLKGPSGRGLPAYDGPKAIPASVYREVRITKDDRGRGLPWYTDLGRAYRDGGGSLAGRSNAEKVALVDGCRSYTIDIEARMTYPGNWRLESRSTSALCSYWTYPYYGVTRFNACVASDANGVVVDRASKYCNGESRPGVDLSTDFSYCPDPNGQPISCDPGKPTIRDAAGRTVPNGAQVGADGKPYAVTWTAPRVTGARIVNRWTTWHAKAGSSPWRDDEDDPGASTQPFTGTAVDRSGNVVSQALSQVGAPSPQRPGWLRNLTLRFFAPGASGQAFTAFVSHRYSHEVMMATGGFTGLSGGSAVLGGGPRVATTFTGTCDSKPVSLYVLQAKGVN